MSSLGHAALGGLAIGLASTALLANRGRVAGISGILVDAFHFEPGNRGWQVRFLVGLCAAGVIGAWLGATPGPTGRTPGEVLAAGGLVGLGARLGNGCTSGHGVCGLARGSARSAAYVVTFMLVGALVVAGGAR